MLVMGRPSLEDFDVAGEGALRRLGQHNGLRRLEMRSKTRPSVAERSSLRYSEWAQTRGWAEPAERPRYMPSGGYIGIVPDLLGQHAADGAEALDAR